MNQPLGSLLLIVILITFSSSCSAKPIVFDDVKNLSFVTERIHSDKAKKNSTLVIFDIDDTLLEAVNFVGSNKWYNWQRGRTVKDLNGKPLTINNEDKFSCIFRTLGTLFELGSTQLTQKNAAQIVTQLKAYDLMLLTARTTIYREATERELNHNGINLSDKHLAELNAELAFNFDDGKRVAKVTYGNGIIMSSGLNKGLVLKNILERIGKTYQHIYFIDDSVANIANMQKEWQNENTNINIFHYTKVNKSISKEEIAQSIAAKKQFDKFLYTAYPDRFDAFQNELCE